MEFESTARPRLGKVVFGYCDMMHLSFTTALKKKRKNIGRSAGEKRVSDTYFYVNCCRDKTEIIFEAVINTLLTNETDI